MSMTGVHRHRGGRRPGFPTTSAPIRQGRVRNAGKRGFEIQTASPDLIQVKEPVPEKLYLRVVINQEAAT
jgi:hypothetical protein